MGGISAALGLKTRGLDALAREKLIDRFTVHAQDAPDPHCVETSVVYQPAHCLRVDAKLVRNLADAHKTPGFTPGRRHSPPRLTSERF